MAPPSHRMRLGILGVVALSLFAALFARLWFLQVLAAPTYKVAAESNQVRLVPEPAPRGRILDRQGRVIVDNRVSRVVTVDRSQLDDGQEEPVVARLAAVLGRPVAELEARLEDPRNSPVQPVVVGEDVPEEVVVRIREHPELFPPDAVQAAQMAVRRYPYGTLAAHVLGYVGEINDAELEARRSRGYRLGDEIGKSGVEQVYERELRGTPGVRKLEVDSHGRVLGTLGHRRPVQGHDLRLTLDLDVQWAAERALQEELAAARSRTDRQTKRQYEAPAGSVVVLDPSDGSLVAMASYPTYDPRSFVGGISHDLFQRLQDPTNHFPLNNRAIQGQYAPGSTFKLITALAGVADGVLTPETTIVDRGSVRIGNRTFRNAGSRPYGSVALPRAITVSSDVYFYEIGRAFWESPGVDRRGIQNWAERFGLGADTGIPLPFEADGRVPDAEVRRQLHEQNPGAFPEGRWFTGDNVNLAIGQGELVVTPLQLANVYATFANGGTRFTPRVASAVLNQDGSEVRSIPPTPADQVEMPAGAVDALRQGLAGVVSSGEGTAAGAFRRFDLGAFPVAGKTGTAQVRGKHDTALFVAYGPTPAPRYVVAVVMEESGFGSTAAAPVARRVLELVAGQAPPAPAELAPPTSDAISAATTVPGAEGDPVDGGEGAGAGAGTGVEAEPGRTEDPEVVE